MINHYASRPAFEPTRKCPAILEHPVYPAWLQLAIIVFESFFIGLIVGKLL